ncbi:MAG: carboxypeptidase-like regulatory domain-containing protein, partial [Bacteroidota bacterium]|nr:carboxypeptidase-like regulatory domain-containing protein [Bacteroidota bacterium]
DDDSPLPGVNIVEKGTSNGTVTGFDGKFEITVSSEKTTLLFSVIGLVSREVTVGSKRIIDVKLNPT